ncbi:transposase [Streptomyces sp. PTD5-9]|uniref:transposase n=1 Tax=Streptomyces sp. PTD5-9 TaxID=3120150 RepID=UPI003FCED169
MNGSPNAAIRCCGWCSRSVTAAPARCGRHASTHPTSTAPRTAATSPRRASRTPSGQGRATDRCLKGTLKVRAGVEGTISQAAQRCGLRRSRYRGPAKTSLQHQLTGAAINLARIDAHILQTPRARTRTSHFAALRPAELILGGAK